jgi:hypothetical protein
MAYFARTTPDKKYLLAGRQKGAAQMRSLPICLRVFLSLKLQAN